MWLDLFSLALAALMAFLFGLTERALAPGGNWLILCL
jgi:hypothetical protein